MFAKIREANKFKSHYLFNPQIGAQRQRVRFGKEERSQRLSPEAVAFGVCLWAR